MSKNKIRHLWEEFVSGISVPEPKPFKPDDFQIKAIESLSETDEKKGKDVLVVAPTGAGKTYIAVEAIKATVQAGGRAVYTAPLKALSNAKYAELKLKFEPDYSVGLLTGDRKIEGDADILVATTEIYRNELYRGFQNYSLVVLDEFHYLSDPYRGAVWEESIILSSPSARILMLSASVSNAREIADWTESIRGRETQIIEVEKRPVELRFGFLHPELGVLPLHSKKGKVLWEIESFYKKHVRRPRGPRGQRGPRGPRSNKSGQRGKK